MFQTDLAAALERNPHIEDTASSSVDVVIKGSCNEPEAVVEIMSYGSHRLVGHAFHWAPFGAAVAAVTISSGRRPVGDPAACIAAFRRDVWDEGRFSPVFASSEEEAYAEMPNGAAAIQRLASMIERIDPRVSNPAEDDIDDMFVEARIIPIYWNPSFVME